METLGPLDVNYPLILQVWSANYPLIPGPGGSGVQIIPLSMRPVGLECPLSPYLWVWRADYLLILGSGVPIIPLPLDLECRLSPYPYPLTGSHW